MTAPLLATRDARTWKTHVLSQADCLTCGETPDGGDGGVSESSRERLRRWARAHAENYPGHHAVIETTTSRSYLAAALTEDPS